MAELGILPGHQLKIMKQLKREFEGKNHPPKEEDRAEKPEKVTSGYD